MLSEAHTEQPWHPTPEDMGIDEGARARLARLILDQTIELEPSGRPNAEYMGEWDVDSLKAYGKWLRATLQLDSKTPLTKWMLDRASHLNLGPSSHIIYDNPDIGSMSDYQHLLDTPANTDIENWTKDQCAHRGILLSKKYGRLTKAKLNQLARDKQIPGSEAIRTRFGSLRAFHEATGYPSFRGATHDDMLDWGVAFYKQNPDRKLTEEALDELSGRGVAPSAWSAYNKFEYGIIEFRERAEAQYEQTIWEHAQRELATRKEMKTMEANGLLPAGLFDGQPEDRHLRIFAMYRVSGELERYTERTIEARDRLRIARHHDVDRAVEKLTSYGHSITASDVEVCAEELGIYDHIWPTERFANVDLRLAA